MGAPPQGMGGKIHRLRKEIFIDGGYLRKVLKGFNVPVDNAEKTAKFLLSLIRTIQDFGFISPVGIEHSTKLELIRAYYYDALPEPKDETYQTQEEFFSRIEERLSSCPFELRFGRLQRASKNREEFRQKGVDVLLATDIVTMAFLNHYDIAVLVSGDQDFVHALQVVRNFVGKRVIGVYEPRSCSKELERHFDFRFPFAVDSSGKMTKRKKCCNKKETGMKTDCHYNL